jgi:hypothetical protein
VLAYDPGAHALQEVNSETRMSIRRRSRFVSVFIMNRED